MAYKDPQKRRENQARRAKELRKDKLSYYSTLTENDEKRRKLLLRELQETTPFHPIDQKFLHPTLHRKLYPDQNIEKDRY